MLIRDSLIPVPLHLEYFQGLCGVSLWEMKPHFLQLAAEIMAW
jgi:hypothetical protein